jgi:L-arabinose isomerase
MNMKEIWFLTGSQHLYGEAALKQVSRNAEAIAQALGADPSIPVKVVFRPIVTTPDEIRTACVEASASDACVGLITWMHTFSPAKMWIAGLTRLTKPYLPSAYAVQPRHPLG